LRKLSALPISFIVKHASISLDSLASQVDTKFSFFHFHKIKEESSSFLKKRTKKLLFAVADISPAPT